MRRCRVQPMPWKTQGFLGIHLKNCCTNGSSFFIIQKPGWAIYKRVDSYPHSPAHMASLDAREQLLCSGVHLREGWRGTVDGVEPRVQQVCPASCLREGTRSVNSRIGAEVPWKYLVMWVCILIWRPPTGWF